MNKKILGMIGLAGGCILFLYACSYHSYTTTSGLKKDPVQRDTSLKYLSVSLYDTTQSHYKIVFEHFYTAAGKTDSISGNKTYYDHYIYPLSTTFLVDEKTAGWVYRPVDSSLVFRDHYVDDHLKESCRIRFDTLGRVSYIRIKYDWPLRTQIKYYYNNDGLLSMRLIVISLGPTYVEKYIYNEQQQLVHTFMYDVINDMERSFLKLDYVYRP